jgi:hypothetical protein
LGHQVTLDLDPALSISDTAGETHEEQQLLCDIGGVVGRVEIELDAPDRATEFLAVALNYVAGQLDAREIKSLRIGIKSSSIVVVRKAADRSMGSLPQPHN